MLGLAKAREVGGSLVVTIPRPIVSALGIAKGEFLEVSVAKPKRSYFGAFKGLPQFGAKDKMMARL